MASGQSTPTKIGTYEGLAMPLYGEAVMTQQNSKDILSLKYATTTPTGTPTGNFLSFLNSGGTVLASVTGNANLQLRVYTTKPTTGLAKGELYCLFHGSRPYLAVCTSSATSAARMIRLRTKTNGRLTA